ncbi:MAG: MATE family efflux transporter, partial [Ignavibacteria bacterium]|nr:MATE family efflux transporter [Ignavibacteria bacterium]
MMDNYYISYKNILRISIPVMVGSFANNIINVVDTALLSRVSQVALGASAIGGIFYFIMIMAGGGFNTGMQIMIARRVGEKNNTEVGKIFDNQLYQIIVISLIAFIILHVFGDYILHQLIQSSAIQKAASEFIYYRSYGIFFGILNSCFLAFYIGIGQTTIVNYTTIVLAIINALLAFCFIFGSYGFPEMGIGGAGLASTIAEAIVTGIYFIYTIRSDYAKQYSLFQFLRVDYELIK